MLRLYRKLVIAVDWTLTHLYVRKFEVVGRENVPPTGALILASNHLNNADPPMVALAIRPRLPMFMAKREMISWPVLGFLLRMFGAFPVRRGEADLAALRAATEYLEQGSLLVMFPEGTRSRTGSMNQGHPGTGVIAMRTGVPVLPVGITGSEGIGWPWIFLKPFSVKHIKVTIGKPFTLPKHERINSETSAEGTTFIMRKIAELLPPEYRGVYADAADQGVPEGVKRAEGVH
ncbi:MAG TPA: lysophospholipid acyltransferase family protein [Dehalococcoidia bacterium]|jgi:1-acyl-sn-glycerol-3-phosphate acyltransferase